MEEEKEGPPIVKDPPETKFPLQVVSETYVNMTDEGKAMVDRMVHAAKLAKSQIESVVTKHIKKVCPIDAQDGSALAIALGQLDGIIGETGSSE